MPKLNYTAKGFHSDLGKCLNGCHSIDVTWAELIWAGITVGRKSWENVIRHGYHSFLEIIYRTAILKANLSSSPQGEFIKTDAYKSLDPSEKSAISYFLGLSFAKLVAHRLLSVPWLVHLDCFEDLPIEIDMKDNNRPDLIGTNLSGEWCVFEAKGRTHNIDEKLIQKAKNQAHMIKRINGMAPRIKGASLSHFSSEKLRLYLEGSDEIDSTDADFENSSGKDQFLESYYHPFVSLMENSTATIRETDVVRMRGREINFVNLEEVDLDVGLDSQVQEILTSDYQAKNALMSIYYLCSQHPAEFAVPTKAHSDNNDTTFIGWDGIFVRPGSSWI